MSNWIQELAKLFVDFDGHRSRFAEELGRNSPSGPLRQDDGSAEIKGV
jgi:hypothetical protein